MCKKKRCANASSVHGRLFVRATSVPPLTSGDRNRFPVLARRLLSTHGSTKRSLPHIH